MGIRRWLTGTLFGILLVSCSSVVMTAQDPTQTMRQAEPFILPTWNGGIIKSSSLKGQVIMLEFFQTSCSDCQEIAPAIEGIYEQYKEKGFTIVGISHDKAGAKAIEPYAEKYKITYPIVIGDLSIAINYAGVTPEKPNFRIPFIVLIDRKGFIAGKFEQGQDKEAMDPKLLEAVIRKLLGVV